MIHYITKRIFHMVLVVIGISFIIFTVMSLTPGDPAQIILGDGATPEDIAQLRNELGLNDNLFIRFFRYISNAVQGDLGTSYRTGDSVVSELFNRFPNTALLAIFGVGGAALIGVPIGIISAVKQYSIIDNVTMIAAMVMTSIPAFWLGLLLMLQFALNLGWLPAIGADSWQSFILPSTTLAIGNMAVIIRMTRSTMLEVIREDYIRTAKAKGAGKRSIILTHALKNALLPVVTTIGINFGTQLGGAIVVETVFSIPGLGTLIITSVRQKDIPMVTGAVLFIALTICIVTFTMDILYSFLDPRVELHSKYKRIKTRKKATV